MTRAKKTRGKKSFRLELTKEQRALVLQKIGMEAQELELTVEELARKTDSKQEDNQP
jgi:phosphoribosyl-ATP pyrophosphohydrolase